MKYFQQYIILYCLLMFSVNSRVCTIIKFVGTYMKKMILMVMIIPLLLISNKPVAAEDTTNLQEETIYNILVDRYNNGDPSLDGQKRIDDPYAYHGGDIKGITKKLDEI